MKKYISILLVAIFSITLNIVSAVDYEIESYDIDAIIKENGDMVVTEYIKYDFDEQMNGLYRDLLYSYKYHNQKDDMSASSVRYQASSVEDLKVWVSDSSFKNMDSAIKRDEKRLSNGMDGYYSAEYSSGEESRLVIKVYSPVRAGHKKYVKYEYTIKDAVVNYEDFAEIYWNFIGGDWQCHIANVTITLKLPNETNLKAYGHTFGSEDSFTDDGETITYKIKSLSSGVAADIRAVFSNEIMNKEDIKKQVDLKYDFDELYKIEEKLAENIRKNKIYMANNFFIGIIAIVMFVIAIIKASKKKAGVLKNYKKAEVFTDVLDKNSLTDYNKMLNHMNTSLSGNMIIATIMDLSYKKAINMDSRKKMGTFKDKYEYYLTLNKNFDFNTLNDYEKVIINYIFFKKASYDIDISNYDSKEFELNERFKELSKKESLASSIRTKIMSLDTKSKKELYGKVSKKKYKPCIIAILALITMLILNTFVYCIPENYFASMYTGLVLVIMYSLFLVFMVSAAGVEIKDEYVEEHNRLLGLKKYLSDYGTFKAKYPIEIALWDRYMVFACLFGIADKVAKEFKEELLAKGLSEDEINSSYSYMYMAHHINSYNSTISAATYAGSRGSSSSGGFHGGGGGGRRWRWRWRLLKNLISKLF